MSNIDVLQFIAKGLSFLNFVMTWKLQSLY